MINLQPRISPEFYRPAWRTTRFWVSLASLGLSTACVVLGLLRGDTALAVGGAGAGSVASAAYVLSVSRR